MGRRNGGTERGEERERANGYGRNERGKANKGSGVTNEGRMREDTQKDELERCRGSVGARRRWKMKCMKK